MRSNGGRKVGLALLLRLKTGEASGQTLAGVKSGGAICAEDSSDGPTRKTHGRDYTVGEF